MSDIAPWLEIMRTITGLTEYSSGSNPKIEAMAAYIGKKFPEQADYASLYTDDSIAWCGVTAAFCMAASSADGISGPFGATDTDRWMWALSWSDDPTYRHLPAPVQGCWVVMERDGGGHITCFEEWDEGMLVCRGGNQSNCVNTSRYDPDTVVAYVWPQSVPVPPTPPADRPNIEEGDEGPAVAQVQHTLGVYPEDGDFGNITDSAVKGYQSACAITVDGEVGPQTWGKLDELDQKVLDGDEGLPSEMIGAIIDVAENSSIARYSWDDRGQAPLGYTAGVALCFALALDRLNSEDDAAYEMAQANTGDDTDVFEVYAQQFRNQGMDNDEDADPAERLRHLFALMLGLGMRESSGRYCEGRDQSVPPGYYGPAGETTEAGCWQTSWDIRSCSSNIPPLLNEYWKNPCGFRETFQKGVTLHSNDELTCPGEGEGTKYQFLSKYAPAMHALITALGLRNRCNHWGPINRGEAELKAEADQMLQAVQALVESGVEPEPEPPPDGSANRVDITVAKRVKLDITITGDVDVFVNGDPWE